MTVQKISQMMACPPHHISPCCTDPRSPPNASLSRRGHTQRGTVNTKIQEYKNKGSRPVCAGQVDRQTTIKSNVMSLF